MELTILNAVETEFRTIRIKTPTSFSDLGRFHIYTFHASFAGKNSGLSQTAIKHFSYFPHSAVIEVHHSDAFSSFSTRIQPILIKFSTARTSSIPFLTTCIYFHAYITYMARFHWLKVPEAIRLPWTRMIYAYLV